MSADAERHDPGTQVPVLRGNRRKPACEPCRKQKWSCDHGQPTCSRCIRRGLSAQCFYHPSPMTRDGPRRKRTSKAPTIEEAPISPDYSARASFPTPTSLPDERGSEAPAIPVSAIFPSAHAGRLGPTSFSAIFSENQADLGQGLWDAEAEINDHEDWATKKTTWGVSVHDEIQLGMKVLNLLPSRKRCQKLLDRYFVALHPMDPILHRPTVQSWHDGLWETFGKCLEEPREPKKLRAMAQKMCNNGRNLTDPAIYKDYSTWVSAFTGPQFRWETLGILLAVCGNACTTYPAWNHTINTAQGSLERSHFATQMLSCTRECMQLCASSDDANDLRIYLIYLSLCLRVNCGEEGGRPWFVKAQLVSAITELGLHHRKETEAPISFLLSQLRKRTFACVFGMDKLMSTHTGRPPTLCRRYCTTQPPLDIDDDQLTRDPTRVELELINQGIDNSGWDVSGNVYPSTYIHALAMMCEIRDAILELFLGPVDESTIEKVEELRAELERSYASLPPQIRYDTYQTAPSAPTPAICIQQIFIALEYHYNKFLLERAPTNSSVAQHQSLRTIAQDILSIILAMWSRRDFMVDFQWQFIWVIVEYGIPSAGVLCMELLRHARPDPTSTEPLPRAQIIQSLSVFLSCLDWIPMEIRNMHKLCDRMSNIIKRILERVLSPAPVAAAPQELETEQGDGEVGVGANDGGWLPFPNVEMGTESYPGMLDWTDLLDWNHEVWMDVMEGTNFLVD